MTFGDPILQSVTLPASPDSAATPTLSGSLHDFYLLLDVLHRQRE